MYKCDMKHISAAMLNICAYVLRSMQLQWNSSLSGVYSDKSVLPKELNDLPKTGDSCRPNEFEQMNGQNLST